MRSLRIILAGIITGAVIGTIALLVVRAGLTISGMGHALPIALLVSGPLSGAAAGAVGTAAGCLVAGRERTLVAILAAVAVASLAVYGGSYGNSSLAPPALYGLALINGLVVARVIGPLCTAYGKPEQNYL